MADELNVKAKDVCRWDCVSLGEVMLRLDPGDGRIATTRTFQVWEGGGEYNVARGLKRCFGMETAIVTALADNPVGRLVQDLIYQGGVDQSHLVWTKDDGVGRTVRNGLNFTERGFGVRAALGCSDRGHTAVSQLEPGSIDWEKIFVQEGARWFHTGGIFCALSESTPAVAREAMEVAKRAGTIISYDLNYRDSLWKSIGGQQRAREVNRELAPFVDVMIGNEEDFTAALGFEVEGLDEHHSKLDVENFRRMIERAVREFPNFKTVATTLRNARTATLNDWGAVCYAGLGGNPYRDGSYQYYLSEPVVTNDPKGVGAFLLAAGEMEIADGLAFGLGKTVMLDYYFNNEVKKDSTGALVPFHYKWEEMPNSGFSLWGSIFINLGARIEALRAAPTAENLKRTDIYIIVDPDTKDETESPRFVEAAHVKAITDWSSRAACWS